MKTHFNSVNRVKATWLYEDEIYFYESVPGSIIVNPKAKTIRFELRELSEREDNFEVLVRETNGSYVFETDHELVAEGTYPLRRFVADDESIFFLEDGSERIYIHLLQ
ncbi:MAG: hypothetical protein LC754_15890 [Acidobacteria bacterium]|nr:hypothetical protein [Acidobacteriota bacterium]